MLNLQFKEVINLTLTTYNNKLNAEFKHTMILENMEVVKEYLLYGFGYSVPVDLPLRFSRVYPIGSFKEVQYSFTLDSIKIVTEASDNELLTVPMSLR